MLDRIIAEANARRELGKKHFEELDSDLCMLCHAYGADKRNLRINCFYAIDEVVPEAIDMTLVDKSGYYLRICKSCRGELLQHLKEWRDSRISLQPVPKDHDGCVEETDSERNIPVRINGAVVLMNQEEFERYKAEQGSTGGGA